MSRFSYCYPADGLMWCQHHNGSWAPPFPIGEAKPQNEISPTSEEESEIPDEETDPEKL